MRLPSRLLHVTLGAAIALAAVAGYAVGANEPEAPIGAELPDPRAGAPSPAESVFVPITPCRIVSTAVTGGKFNVAQTRSYAMSGDVTVQGGKAGGCGIPATASALEVTIAAPLAEGNGYLRAWPGAQSEPNATFMGFGAGPSFTNTGTVSVSPGASNNLKVKVYGARTHVLIDVQGYYVKGLLAVVSSSGDLQYGSGVLSTSRSAAGEFDVRFDRVINGCAYAVNPFGEGVTAAVFRDGGTEADDDLVVYLNNVDETPRDVFFSLIVTC